VLSCVVIKFLKSFVLGEWLIGEMVGERCSFFDRQQECKDGGRQLFTCNDVLGAWAWALSLAQRLITNVETTIDHLHCSFQQHGTTRVLTIESMSRYLFLSPQLFSEISFHQIGSVSS
jgi:hypothetical protein